MSEINSSFEIVYAGMTLNKIKDNVYLINQESIGVDAISGTWNQFLKHGYGPGHPEDHVQLNFLKL